ncbi:MAG: hypothetical protein ACKVP3_05900 [Hyphomicrobiaceae bacterium]
MRTLSAFALAMVLATGGALAQGSGGAGSGGGTPSGPGGTSTGKDAAAKPTAQDCARGYQAGSRWTQAEFNEACKK